jgi:hypothetical protein
MQETKRPLAFWGICLFLAISLVFLLLGQTTAIFAYDLAVSWGLQESVEDVSAYGVEVNRSFGVGDTLVYVPLVVWALVGLWRRKSWSLPVAGAVMGISAYWAVTILAMLHFLSGKPGYNLEPGVAYWIILGTYIGVGVWGVVYVSLRGHHLVGDS